MSTPIAGVLVVGAGPAGLTLACDLARRGVNCRLVERGGGSFMGSRGAAVQPRTQEVFEDLGVLDDIYGTGGRFPVAMRWDGKNQLGAIDLVERNAPTPGRPYSETWMIPQWRTIEILRARYEGLGGHVESGELTSLVQGSDDVTATVWRSDGTRELIEARYLVAADGARSVVRESLDVAFDRVGLDAPPMLLGDVVIDNLDYGYWHIWPTASGGLVTLCPMKGGDTFAFIVQFADSDTAPDVDHDGTPEGLERLLSSRTGYDFKVGKVPFVSILHPRTAILDRFRIGRVFFAGDAAHVHSPSGGQGLNTSVQDSYNLGWKLEAVLHHGAPPALLETYHTERHQVAAEVLRRSSGLLRRDRKDTKVGFSKRESDTHQLDLEYRDSPLTVERRPSLRDDVLRAGDLAPDAPCTDASGARVRLFDLFRGPRFTLLAFGDSPTPELSDDLVDTYRICSSQAAFFPAALIDTERHARNAYADQGLFLVRPDGYCAVATLSPDDVRAYLSWQHLGAPASSNF